LKESGKTEAALLKLLKSKQSAKEGQKLGDLSTAKLVNIGKAWASLVKEMV
jgi:hypothetical protein